MPEKGGNKKVFFPTFVPEAMKANKDFSFPGQGKKKKEREKKVSVSQSNLSSRAGIG